MWDTIMGSDFIKNEKNPNNLMKNCKKYSDN